MIMFVMTFVAYARSQQIIINYVYIVLKYAHSLALIANYDQTGTNNSFLPPLSYFGKEMPEYES